MFFRMEGFLLSIFAVGMVPIAAIAMSVTELCELCNLGPFVIPIYFGAIAFIVLKKNFGSYIVIRGYVSGFVAVLLYDLCRWSMSYHLGLSDFIPSIGDWLLGSSPPQHWFWGYAWRYLGNGAGMGMAGYALYNYMRYREGRIQPILFGICYGVAIWLCLLATIILAPDGETLLFELNQSSLMMTFVGHVVYGGALGVLYCSSESMKRLVIRNITSLNRFEETFSGQQVELK